MIGMLSSKDKRFVQTVLTLAYVIPFLCTTRAQSSEQTENILAYLNHPVNVEGLVVVITNYAPTYAFKDVSSLNDAKKKFGDRLSAAVSSSAYISADSSLPGYVYSELSGASPLTDSLSAQKHVLRGQFRSTWWEKTRRNFNVLTNSNDGTFVDNGKTNRAFALLKRDAFRVFDLGIPEYERGTFAISGEEPDLTWVANTESGQIHGKMTIEGEVITLSGDKRGTTRPYSSKIRWSVGNTMPSMFELIDYESQRSLISYTISEGTTNTQWRFPEAFDYPIHTNDLEVIMFIGPDGGRGVLGGRTVEVRAWRGVPLSRVSILLIPLLGLLGVGLTWYCLRTSRQNKTKNNKP